MLRGRERSVCPSRVRLFQGGEEGGASSGGLGAARRGLVQRHVARWAAGRRGGGLGGHWPREVLKDYNGLRACPSRPRPALPPPPTSTAASAAPAPGGECSTGNFFEAAASPGKPVPLRAAPSLGLTALPQSEQPAPSSLHETLVTFLVVYFLFLLL